MSRTFPVFRLIHMHTLQRPDKQHSRQLRNLIDTHAHAAAARQRTQSSTTEPSNYNGTMSRTFPVFRLIHMLSTRCSGQTNNTVANYGTW
ncbi:hypothetical protein J6590_047946 [Homalodisca vitripennis]|nr:hypothetical protein J6590_047946 [Homalodisca vitripennis]